MQNPSREQENVTKIKWEQINFESFKGTNPCTYSQEFLYFDIGMYSVEFRSWSSRFNKAELED